MLSADFKEMKLLFLLFFCLVTGDPSDQQCNCPSARSAPPLIYTSFNY